MLVLSAIVVFALPIATMVMSAHIASGNLGASNAAAAGAVIGGTIAASVVGIFAFFAGGILLIVGLLVGRDPKVIYVEKPQTETQDRK